MQTVTLFPRTRVRKAFGFSLIELLVVVAILALLVGIGVNTLAGSGTKGVDKAGNTLSSIAQLARQNAVSKNAVTGLVFNEVSVGPDKQSAVSIWDVDSLTKKASQIERWTLLPATVSVSVDGANVPVLDVTGFTYQNSIINSPKIIWFFPDGHIGNGSDIPRVKMTPVRGATDNSYELVFNPVVGTHKINRP